MVVSHFGAAKGRAYELVTVGQRHPMGWRVWRLLSELRGCWHALRNFKPDVIQVVSSGRLSLWVMALAQQLGIPVFYGCTLLGSDDPAAVRSSRFGRFRAKFIRRCDGVIAISPAIREAAVGAGVPIDRVHLIANDVDCDRFTALIGQSRHELRKRLGLDPNEFVLVTVGAVIPRKGTLALVSAYFRAPLKAQKSCLCVIGPVPDSSRASGYRASIDEVIQEAPTDRRVLFVGPTGDISNWLSVADSFIFASRQEGFASVLIEAMAAELPIALKAIPGLSDFIAGSEPGVIQVESDDMLPQAFANLEVLSSNVDLRRGLRKRAVRYFSSPVILGRYEALFVNSIKR